MNLKTTVTVSCSIQGRATPSNAKVVGLLNTKVLHDSGIEVGVKYQTESGELVLSDSRVFTWEQVNALYEAIKETIPTEHTFKELIDIAFMESFKIQMAETFNIATAQIEMEIDG